MFARLLHLKPIVEWELLNILSDYLPECELTNDLKTACFNQLLDVIFKFNVGEYWLSVVVLMMTLFRITLVMKTFLVASASVSKRTLL